MVTGLVVRYIEDTKGKVVNINVFEIRYKTETKGYKLRLAKRDHKGRQTFVTPDQYEKLLDQHGLEMVDPTDQVTEQVTEQVEVEVVEVVEPPKKKRKRRSKAEIEAEKNQENN